MKDAWYKVNLKDRQHDRRLFRREVNIITYTYFAWKQCLSFFRGAQQGMGGMDLPPTTLLVVFWVKHSNDPMVVHCMKFNSNTIVQLYDSISNTIRTFPQTTAECIGPTFQLCLSPHWNFWLKILRSIYSDVTTYVHENMRMKVTRHWRNLINK